MTDKNDSAPGKHVILDFCGATVLDVHLHHFGEGMGV